MKHIVLVFFVFSLTPTVWSQEITFYASVKGDAFASFLVNSSITEDANQNYSFALAGAGGLGGAVYFSPRQPFRLGLSFDFLIGKHKASYNAKGVSVEGDQSSFQSEVSFRSLHIPLLLSFYTLDERERDPEAYFQIGPQFNNCTSPTYTSDGYSNDISEFCANNYWSGVIGFGRIGQIVNNIRYFFGMRVEYGFGDLGGVNAFGIPIDTQNGTKMRVMGVGFEFGVTYEIGDLRNLRLNFK